MQPTMEATPNIKTYRGRSVEAMLPKIRTELGDDAVVVRCREGLSGGIGGFFQRPCVEIEAAARQGAPAAAAAPDAPDVPALEMRSDRATAEGLAAPAVQLLFEQAAPFADQLRAAKREQADDGEPSERREEALGAVGLTGPGLYGPQPMAQREPLDAEPQRARAVEETIPSAARPPAAGETAGAERPSGRPAPPPASPLSPDPPAQPGGAPCALPSAGRTAERRLALSGLDSALAAELVGEAVVHGIPFSSARAVKKLVRGVLTQRLRVLGHRGTGAVTLAVTGPAGAGTSTAVGHLAVAYAGAYALPVVVIALRSADAGEALRGRLAEFDVHVEAASDGMRARRIAAANPGAMVFVDAPSVTVSDSVGCARLARDLTALAPDELHLALPATLSTAAADELAELLDPVGLTHVALTRMDETRRPGAGLGFCLATGRSLSYLSTRDTIAPADAATVAQLLLP